MKLFVVKKRHIAASVMALAVSVTAQPYVHASTFGAGVFGADVPFGSATSISIALSNNVDINPVASGGSLRGTGTHTVTVTSTDVVGYDLYVNATSGTAMIGGSSSIHASSNTTASPLSVNSWGYNTTGSTTNFKGITTSQALINSGVGPFKGGVATNMTYGTAIGMDQSSGVYTVGVTYTAVGRN